MSKFVVTGGCGFVGSHLVERLLRDGHRVVVIDNLSTGFESYLPVNDKLTFVRADISNWADISTTFSYWQEADGVFHLAACARIQPSVHQPILTNDTNVTGTLHVLEMMRMCKVKSIVYSGSSSYYGLNPVLPCFENAAHDCQTPYSISKYMGELYCKTWGKLHGMRNVCLRYFNVYGRRSPLSGPYAPVIGLFFRQAFTGQPLTIVGDGEQRRDFTHVSDVVEANVLAMKRLNAPDWSDVTGLSINIGTGKNYSIKELADIVRNTLKTSGKESQVTYVPKRVGEAQVSLADNTFAKQLLDWEPMVDLENGCDDLKQYYWDNVEKLKSGVAL